MWAEIVFSRDDLARALQQALPLTIQLGDADVHHSLTLSDLGDVTLLPDLGLRIVCKARIHWLVLGIDPPISIKALTAVLLPAIGRGPDGDTMVFRLSIEHADFSGLPEIVDDGITAAINAKLAAKEAELCWNFSKTLTFNAPLPNLLESLTSFAAKPAWGKVRISEEAVVYAASFHSAFVRRGETVPVEISDGPYSPPAPAPTAPPVASASPSPSVAAKSAARIGLFGLSAGLGYAALRAVLDARRRR